MDSLGRHILIEFYGCDVNILNNPNEVKQMLEDAARNARATVIESFIHHFNPFGVSGVVVISESHLTIHTWPEYGYAAVDVFTCGEEVDPWNCFSHIQEKLKSKSCSPIELKRGILNVDLLRHKPPSAKVAA